MPRAVATPVTGNIGILKEMLFIPKLWRIPSNTT